MPEISRFLGIVVAMYYRDHNPPHFHAWYGRQQATIAIEDWRLARDSAPLRPIAPLD